MSKFKKVDLKTVPTAKYADMREKLKTGDVLAFSKLGFDISPAGIFAMAIRLFTMRKVYHVGTVVRFGGRVMVIEAMLSGVRVIDVSSRVPVYHVSTNIEVTPHLENRIMSDIGEGYALLEAICSYCGMKPKKDGKWFCTEFTKDILMDAGWKDEDLPSLLPGKFLDAVVAKAGNITHLTK